MLRRIFLRAAFAKMQCMFGSLVLERQLQERKAAENYFFAFFYTKRQT